MLKSAHGQHLWLLQCDQIGLFLKGLFDTFVYKSRSKISQLFGATLKSVNLKVKTIVVPFGPLF